MAGVREYSEAERSNLIAMGHYSARVLEEEQKAAVSSLKSSSH